MSCRRWTSVIFALAVVSAAAGDADAQSDLRCFKVKDPLALKGIVDFESAQVGLEQGCSIKKGAFLCVPGTTTVVEANNKKDPIALLPVTGADLSDSRICYKLKCENAPAPQGATDLFGGRTLELKNVGMLCTAALDGVLNPSCTVDAHCDDGDPCNGFETCDGFSCSPGTPIGCNPGDIVFVVPFGETPSPSTADVVDTPSLQAMDVYLLLDRSGSMSSENSALKTNAASILNGLACPPLGSGTPGSCIPDLWGGAGTIGYTGSGGNPYLNSIDLAANPNFAAVPTSEPGGCCAEPHLLAAWSSMTGFGSASAVSGFGGTCTVTDAYADRASCASSPAVLAGFGATGYPCFRSVALPVVVIATDEAPTLTVNCPPIADTVAAATATSTRIVGLVGSGAAAQTRTDLESLALQTGAIDATATPLVFDGFDANAGAAFQAAIAELYDSPLDARAVLVDDPDDAVDVVAEFLDRVQTLQLGTSECPSALPDQDSDGDTFPDEYVFLPRGNAACWRVQAKSNATIAQTASPQVFEASLEIQGARRARMAPARRVLFVVPPGE